MPRKGWYKVAIIYRSALTIISAYVVIDEYLRNGWGSAVATMLVVTAFFFILAVIAFRRMRRAKA